MTTASPRLRSRGGSLVLGLAALALAGLFSSCSFLLDDGFPAYDQRIVAMCDFDATVKQAFGSELLDLSDIRYLESSASSGVFAVLLTQDGAIRFLALDGTDLGSPAGYAIPSGGYFGSNAGVDASGNFVSGLEVMSASTRLPISVIPYPAVYNQQLLSEAGVNYFYSTSLTTLNSDRYDSGYAPLLPSASILISTTGSWSLKSAGQAGGYYLFLFNRLDTGGYRAFRTTSLSSMPWTSLFDDPTVSADDKTAEFTSDDQMSVWVTADGPVSVSYNNNGRSFKLLRFGAAGDSSSYSLNLDGSASFSFDFTGNYWFMREPATGKLYKLRTWWK